MRDAPNEAGTDPIAVPVELMIWLSPGFPVGAFAYSHGLEKAAEFGWVRDRASCEAWIGELVTAGSLRNDLVLLAAAWRAAMAGQARSLAEVNETALALQPSAERHLETVAQGGAFLTAVGAAWIDDAALSALGLDAGCGRECNFAYPVVVGAAAAIAGMALPGVAMGYGVAFVSNLCSAAIRLSLIGQTDGQRIIAAALADVDAAARHATTAMLEDLGGSAFASDLASMAHETQYTRLFRS